MKKYMFLILACFLVAVFAFAVLRANHRKTDEQDCGNVKILGGVGDQEDRIYVEPEVIRIEKGGCASWFNQFGADESKAEVTLIVEDTKLCLDLSGTYNEVYVGSGGKVNFVPEGCNVTYWIPHGETSGIRFLEIGTYEYVVNAKEGLKAEGKVVVR